MANCPICGSFFANAAGVAINSENKNTKICVKCSNEKREFTQLLKNGNKDAAGKKYLFIIENLNKRSSETPDYKIIINEMNRISVENNASFEKLYKLKVEELEEAERKKERVASLKANIMELRKKVMLTTGYNFEGYKITSYKGIQSGSSVLGTGFFTEFMGSVADMLDMESGVYQDKLKLAKQVAQERLIIEAVNAGANAVIGVDFDYLTVGNNMIAVSANGTAVIIEKEV